MSKEKDKLKLSKYAESRHRLIMDSFNTPREEREQVYLPASLAHVYFPRRDPKSDPDSPFVHSNGHYKLYLKDVGIENPNTDKTEHFGLPFGPKARIILSVINAMALQQGSQTVDIDADSLTKFIERIGLSVGGNQFTQVQNQVRRLTGSIIRIYYKADEQDGSWGKKPDMPLINGFEFFPRADPNQMMLWKRHIELGDKYWEELQKHAVPLSLEHLKILSGNARAIDVYTFLAYRLHALDKPLFLAWATLKEMFGGELTHMYDFKKAMRDTLTLVKLAYRDAKIDMDSKGLTFRNSPAPISARNKIVIP
ncbi:replication protein RepA [Runella aurantiaca]|jgi:hypothetical protein|uniref:Plasmid encoded RepA protein n=1 Tax=Runella aurantiaca TaxID=2282308 RepID=A0A369HXQ3_9BACT|nr:replication protein RepA [Runella aurantiaca]RDB02299.1 hypothetical protein DVG78_29540 [Runella aurantiaca]